MCDFEDFDPCDVWREKPVIARKPHRCSCCSIRIAPKNAYMSHFSVAEGDTCSEAMCVACWAARDEFSNAHGGNMPTPGYFWELLRDCVDESGSTRKYWGPEDRRWRSLFAGLVWRNHLAVRRLQ
jgi:hypothetical protein